MNSQNSVLIKICVILSACFAYLIYQYKKLPKISAAVKYRRSQVNYRMSKRCPPYICSHHRLHVKLGEMALLDPFKCDVCKLERKIGSNVYYLS